MQAVIAGPPPELRSRFAAEPKSAGRVRKYVGAILAEICITGEFGDDVVLLVSELVTNAILAVMRAFSAEDGRPEIAVALIIAPGKLFFVVFDSAPGMPIVADFSDPNAEHGRGLAIAGALGARVTAADDGDKRVVAEIPLPPRVHPWSQRQAP